MKGSANHLAIGAQPTKYHQWVPGIGWTFMPEYAEGESLAEQSASNDYKGHDVRMLSDAARAAEGAGITSYRSGEEGRLSFGEMGRTAEDMARVRQRQASHDWYTSGMNHYEGPYDESSMLSWYNDRTGRKNVSPWVDTFDHDRQATWNAVKEDGYNAFLGSEGGFTNDPLNSGSRNEGYRDDSIAGWFKQAFADQSMADHRKDAIFDLRVWNERPENAGYGIDKGTTKMTQELFDSMGLADKYGGMSLQSGSSNNGSVDMSNYTPLQVGTGFLGAYNAKREELDNKPSVMSLFKEMKEFT